MTNSLICFNIKSDYKTNCFYKNGGGRSIREDRTIARGAKFLRKFGPIQKYWWKVYFFQIRPKIRCFFFLFFLAALLYLLATWETLRKRNIQTIWRAHSSWESIAAMFKIKLARSDFVARFDYAWLNVRSNVFIRTLRNKWFESRNCSIFCLMLL